MGRNVAGKSVGNQRVFRALRGRWGWSMFSGHRFMPNLEPKRGLKRRGTGAVPERRAAKNGAACPELPEAVAAS